MSDDDHYRGPAPRRVQALSELQDRRELALTVKCVDCQVPAGAECIPVARGHLTEGMFHASRERRANQGW